MDDEYGFDSENDYWSQGFMTLHENWVDTWDNDSDVWQDQTLDIL